MARRATLAWLIAVIAGVIMVVPAMASAQEQGTESDSLENAVAADDASSTEDPAAETPPAEPAAETPAVPAEPTDVADDEAAAESAAPADGGFDGSAGTTKAATPEVSDAPAPAPAAAPEPEPADVSAVEAEVADSPGNGGGAGKAAAGRVLARGGGDLKATDRASVTKPGTCSALRGGAGEVHNTFPDDGSCVQSQFEGGLPGTPDGTADLTINAPSGTVSFDIWEDPNGTVNFTVLSGGPFTGAFYVKGGPVHNQCVFTNVSGGSCSTAINPNNGNPYGFSHLDVCVGSNPPPPPPPDNPVPPDTPPGQTTPDNETADEQDVQTQEEREEREEQRVEEQQELLEEAPPVPSAVTPAPEEGLPFTGLDTGWLALMSLVLLGTGVALRRKVS